jgi:hypothetical protein
LQYSGLNKLAGIRFFAAIQNAVNQILHYCCPMAPSMEDQSILTLWQVNGNFAKPTFFDSGRNDMTGDDAELYPNSRPTSRKPLERVKSVGNRPDAGSNQGKLGKWSKTCHHHGINQTHLGDIGLNCND